MSSLKTNDKQVLEKLFQMNGGWALNFSDRTMGEFFRDNLKIDIYADKYNYGSGSKANRIRGFWMNAGDELVAKSIIELLDYIENQILIGSLERKDFPQNLLDKAREIAGNLSGVTPRRKDAAVAPPITEDEFINREFKNVSLDALGLDVAITDVLRQRLDEIRKCLNAKAPLAVVFLCGSTLEGILLGIASKHPENFNRSKCAAKKDGKVLPFPEWKLASFIDAGADIGILGEDVKKYSHALRDFRNYIHPYEQMASGFNPHEYTAKISWQVLQAAIFEITGYGKRA